MVKPIPDYLMRPPEPPMAPGCFLAHGFLERSVKETRCSEPWPSHQIPREALTSWGLEVTGLGTQSVKGSGLPTSHLHHITRGLSELPEAVLVFLMPSAGPGGRPGAYLSQRRRRQPFILRAGLEGPCTPKS